MSDEICFMCLSDVSIDTVNTNNICKTCKVLIHTPCADIWYNISRGKVTNINTLNCIKCREPSNYKNFGDYFKTQEEMNNLVEEMKTNKEWVYIRCSICDKIKKYIETTCANYFQQNPLYALACGDCTSNAIKKCPGCQIPVQKNGGCNHINCPNCDSHWCWICSKIYPKSEIYNHIDDEHFEIAEDELLYDNYLNNEIPINTLIYNIPERFRTEEMVKTYIKYNPVNRFYLHKFDENVSEEHKQIEYLKWIKESVKALVYIDEQSDMIKREAIAISAFSYKYFKEPTESDKIMAVEKDYKVFGIIEDRSVDLIKFTIKCNYHILEVITDITVEIAIYALEVNPDSTRYLNHINLDERVYLEAIKRDIGRIGISGKTIGAAKCFIEIKNKTQEMCNLAASMNDRLLSYVPGNMQTEELCYKILSKNPRSFVWIIAPKLEYYIYSLEQDNSLAGSIPLNDIKKILNIFLKTPLEEHTEIQKRLFELLGFMEERNTMDKYATISLSYICDRFGYEQNQKHFLKAEILKYKSIGIYNDNILFNKNE